jgi:hypothetical protein
MVQRIGTISSPGVLDFNKKLVRYEHHKIYIKVTNFVSDVELRIEDTTITIVTGDSDDVVNLNSSDYNYKINENGTSSYLLENSRVEDLRVNFISGDATLEVYYTGW